MRKKILVTFLILNSTFLIHNCFGQYTKLFDFAGTSNGSNPYGSLVSDGTFLYGMTYSGGVNNMGTIFKIMPDGSGYSKLLDFANDTLHGYNPLGTLYYDGTFLYGMTYSGGTYNNGTVFKIKTDGSGYAKLLEFTPANGGMPFGALISDGVFLYGMTYFGGTSNLGTIFKIKPDGSGYAELLDFNDTNGSYPNGSLIYDGTFLYGVTQGGGVNGVGAIFKIMPDGTGYTKLLDFPSISDAWVPYGSLIYDGTFLYGATNFGGTGTCPDGCGTIFKLKPDGTGYSKLLDFTGMANGSFPWGNLISDGVFLYGMTTFGGINDSGVVYKIKPDGTGYSKLLDFSGATNGSTPFGSLFTIGNFMYGMTNTGGANNMGTIFKINPIGMGIAANNLKNDFVVFPNPTNGKFNVAISQLANFKMKNIEIYNVVGECIHRQIAKSANLQIDLSEVSNGIYFIQMKSESGVVTHKIIIQK